MDQRQIEQAWEEVATVAGEMEEAFQSTAEGFKGMIVEWDAVLALPGGPAANPEAVLRFAAAAAAGLREILPRTLEAATGLGSIHRQWKRVETRH